eukprot:scaffold16412_cov171-Amphora_coffeaeformis.AAC.6
MDDAEPHYGGLSCCEHAASKCKGIVTGACREWCCNKMTVESQDNPSSDAPRPVGVMRVQTSYQNR